MECLKLADSDRDVDLYHWSSAKFSSTWYDTLSVLVAKGRAQVSVAASSGDWSKRIRDMQYTDHEDYTVGSYTLVYTFVYTACKVSDFYERRNLHQRNTILAHTVAVGECVFLLIVVCCAQVA